MKSSAIVGGSSVLNIGIGVIRTKAMALLLGPAGVGLLGLYGAISELTRSVAGMGINSSGVRQIAEAVGTGDSQRIARTVTALRRVALYTGALGSLLLLVFCKPVSRLTFGDDKHAASVALLALAVFFGDISAAQGALVQGMRRIADLARLNVLGAFYGTLFSIPIVYFYYRRGEAERGVVPSLVCVAAMSIITSWWYARKVKVEKVSISFRQVADEARALLKLGVVFMASSLMALGTAYLIRTIVLRKIGVEAAGFYQAAWQLSGLYVGFIVQAMGADFYPRLTAVASNNTECNRLVNEQAEVGMLLAGPGILGTLTFAPLVIQLFYSAKFEPAIEVLRWNCLGMALRVASWPIGFIMIAKGAGRLFFVSELLSNCVYLCLVWLCIPFRGLVGTGIGFCGVNIFCGLFVYAVALHLSGFSWSPANKRIGLLYCPVVVGLFVSWYVLPHLVAMIVGTAATLLAGIYSLKTLCTLIPVERFPQPAQKLLVLFRLAPARADV